jgi:outer membrane lipoprotein-sorting protein
MKGLFTVFLFFISVLGVQAQDVSDVSPVRVESVTANFIQEKQLPILARPIVSKGQFLFQAPDALRWEYFSPIHTVLLMHDGQTRKFIQRDGKFLEEHGMGVDSMQIVLREITGWLDGEITDTATFQVKSKDGNLIVLIPKNESLAKIISRIELKLLGNSGLMESVTLFEGPESFTRMIFSDGLLNIKIPATQFTKP